MKQYTEKTKAGDQFTLGSAVKISAPAGPIVKPGKGEADLPLFNQAKENENQIKLELK